MVAAQHHALTRAGHEVVVLESHSDVEMKRPFFVMRSAVRTTTGLGGNPLKLLEGERPDVIHVHNLFPNFGTRWMKGAPCPIVTTIHNFRTICANGLLFREGNRCLECPERGQWRGVRNACYHESHAGSIPLAIANTGGPAANPIFRFSKRVIFLNQWAAKYFAALGVSHQKVEVVPNATPDVGGWTGQDVDQPAKWLVAGRLSPEKGVLALVKQWPKDTLLEIAGEGGERQEIESLGKPNVSLLGHRDQHELRRSLASYTGIVVPSRCFEMQPTSAIEALCAGVPVLALRGNAAADIVAASGAGVQYSNSEELHTGLVTIEAQGMALRQRARSTYLSNFSEKGWLHRMENIYAEVAGGV